MHLVFLLARIYPYWALAVSIVLVQIAIFYRRRNSPRQWTCLGAVAILMLGIVGWFVFRGDLNSDVWIKYILGRT
jgi:TctA family transporter